MSIVHAVPQRSPSRPRRRREPAAHRSTRGFKGRPLAASGQRPGSMRRSRAPCRLKMPCGATVRSGRRRWSRLRGGSSRRQPPWRPWPRVEGGPPGTAENGLASNNQDLRLTDNVRRRSEDMLQLLSLHAARSSRHHVAEAANTTCRSSSVRTPANGEFWRSSVASASSAVSLSSTASAPSRNSPRHRSSHSAVIPVGCTTRSRSRLSAARARTASGAATIRPATARCKAAG